MSYQAMNLPRVLQQIVGTSYTGIKEFVENQVKEHPKISAFAALVFALIASTFFLPRFIQNVIICTLLASLSLLIAYTIYKTESAKDTILRSLEAENEPQSPRNQETQPA